MDRVVINSAFASLASIDTFLTIQDSIQQVGLNKQFPAYGTTL